MEKYGNKDVNDIKTYEEKFSGHKGLDMVFG